MIGHVDGNLTDKPKKIKSKKNTDFVACGMGENRDGKETIYYNLLAFDDDAMEALLSLDSGNLVKVVGFYKDSTYEKEVKIDGVKTGVKAIEINRQLTIIKLSVLNAGNKMEVIYERPREER